MSFEGALKEIDEAKFPIWLQSIAKKIWKYSTTADNFTPEIIKNIIEEEIEKNELIILALIEVDNGNNE